MSEWFTAAELIGLLGMPKTISGVIKLAKREHWLSRPREGRGGGREYHISSLPPATRHALPHQAAIAEADIESAAASVTELARAKTMAAGLRAFEQLPAAKRDRARARRWVIEAIASYQRAHDLSHKGAIGAFCADYRRGRIDPPASVRHTFPAYEGATGVSPRSIYGWEKAYREHGLMGLTDSYGNRKGQSKIEQNWALKDVILGLILKSPNINPRKIKDYLAAAHAELDVVAVKSIERFVRDWRTEHRQSYTYTTKSRRLEEQVPGVVRLAARAHYPPEPGVGDGLHARRLAAHGRPPHGAGRGRYVTPGGSSSWSPKPPRPRPYAACTGARCWIGASTRPRAPITAVTT